MDRGNMDGHLGEGIEVKGTLRFEGSVRIDGKFSGKILSPATLILGPKATVDGELQVGEVAVHGTLRGQVVASERITIHGSGRVEADLKTKKLVIEQGAFFQGRCDMEQETPQAPKKEAAPAARPQAEQSAPPKPGEANEKKVEKGD
jgi:cytoskeletal protein CcmA (bactofilin family)